MNQAFVRLRASATLTAIATACLLATGCGGGTGASEEPQAIAAPAGADTSDDTAAHQSVGDGTETSAAGSATEAAMLQGMLASQQEDAALAAALNAQPAQATAQAVNDPAADAGQADGKAKALGAVTISSGGVYAPDKKLIIAELRPSQPLSEQGWQGLNCYGDYPPLNTLPPPGLQGKAVPDGSTTRFGPVADPLNSSRKVFLTRVQKDDPLTASGKRCELIAPPSSATALPMKQDFWYAFSMLVMDDASKTDQEKNADVQSQDQILTQWHVQGYNPCFDMAMKDGKLRMEARYNATKDGGPSSASIVTLWRDTAPVGKVWRTFVVQAKLSPFASDKPYIRVWRDGVRIADRSGPLCYNTTGYHYAKVGYYSWTNMNPWVGSDDRRVYVGGATLLRDPNKQFTEATIRTYLNTLVR